jgi:hypothetical protein
MFFVAGAPAFAQEKIEVSPGGVVIIKQVQGAVKDVEVDHGTVVPSESKTTPPQTTLIYLPPPGARELDDIVRYKVGEAQQPQIEVSVRARAPTLESSKLYEASFKALFVLFILAVLVESGLALLFRWRPFLDYFDSRSVNSLVAFLFSLVLVRLFNLDIASQLIGIYTESKALGVNDWMGWPGSLLTAMIIAGGSAGVNRIFQSFGFRPTSAQEKAPPPELKNDQAWVAVTLVRDKAVGSADVLIKNAVAGTISGASPKRRFWRYFIRDKGRFPQTAGYTVTPGSGYEIELQAYDANGAALPRKTWGPYDIAPRAIIDIELKV